MALQSYYPNKNKCTNSSTPIIIYLRVSIIYKSGEEALYRFTQVKVSVIETLKWPVTSQAGRSARFTQLPTVAGEFYAYLYGNDIGHVHTNFHR